MRKPTSFPGASLRINSCFNPPGDWLAPDAKERAGFLKVGRGQALHRRTEVS